MSERPTVLVAAATPEALSAIAAELPPDEIAPLASRSWAQVEESLGDIPLAAAIVYHQLQDIGPIEFCRGLRGLPGRAELPILLLVPGVARSRQPDDPFDVAMRFPAGRGVLADNLAKVISQRDVRMTEAVTALEAELKQRLRGVENQSYYEILEIDRRAGRDAIVKAYDHFSLRFHPDRLKKLRGDPAMGADAAQFYLLVSEAYQTLLDPSRRKRYDQALKVGKLRYDPSLYATSDDLSALSPIENAKRYLRMAQKELDKNDWKAALTFFRMAHQLDPDNAALAKRVKEAEGKAR